MSETGTERIELFNVIVGLIFAELYKEFPIPKEIDEYEISEKLASNGMLSGPLTPRGQSRTLLKSNDRLDKFLDRTLIWLRDEGVIRTREGYVYSEVVLTSKTFSIMNAVPSGVEQGKITETIGSRLSDAARDIGLDTASSLVKDGASSLLADLSGQVIGGIVKSFTRL